MPIRIPSDLPAAQTLREENIFTMDIQRAETQDIRPLQILVLNLMPTKIVTETQLARLLGNTPLQIEMHLMAVGHYGVIQLRVLVHIVAYHEERGLGAVAAERVEYEWRRLRYRTVVKRQIYCTLVLVHAPDGLRKEPTQPEGRLLQYHCIPGI